MNDNQNYFVTRSTSRVLSIPGGKCSIDIFGDDTNGTSGGSGGAPADAPASSGAPNNASGISAAAAHTETKATSSSATSSSSSNEAMKNKQRAMGESFDLFGSVEEKPNKSAQSSVETKQVDSNSKSDVAAGSKSASISSNQFASSSTTNSYNVITARPTSRVLQEPGGKSSDIIFG